MHPSTTLGARTPSARCCPRRSRSFFASRTSLSLPQANPRLLPRPRFHGSSSAHAHGGSEPQIAIPALLEQGALANKPSHKNRIQKQGKLRCSARLGTQNQTCEQQQQILTTTTTFNRARTRFPTHSQTTCTQPPPDLLSTTSRPPSRPSLDISRSKPNILTTIDAAVMRLRRETRSHKRSVKMCAIGGISLDVGTYSTPRHRARPSCQFAVATTELEGVLG